MIVCRLADILSERRLSRRELARRTGLNINTICKLAGNRNRGVDLRVLDRICKVLDVPPGALFQWLPQGLPKTIRELEQLLWRREAGR